MQLSLLTVMPMILVLVSASAESTSLRGGSMKRGLQAKKCSDAGSTPEYGGDCSNTPTYCGRDRYGPRPPTEDPPSPFPQDPQDGIPPGDNVVSCNYMGSRHGEEDIPPNSDDAHLCFDKRCSSEVGGDFYHWCRSRNTERFGGYHGSCSGTNNCLNLDFHCAEGEYCEINELYWERLV